MATVASVGLPRIKFTDNNNRPAVNGSVMSYLVGSTTLAPTYTDATGSVPNPNPILLDERGEAEIWFDIDLTYTLAPVLASGIALPILDNVAVAGAGSGTQLASDLMSGVTGKGSALVVNKTSAAGAVVREVRAKLDDYPDLRDYDTTAGIAGNDDTDSVTKAIADALTGRVHRVRVPKGIFNLTAPITITGGGIHLEGDGNASYKSSSTTAANPQGTGSMFHLAHTGKGFIVASGGDSPNGSGMRFSNIGTMRDQPIPTSGAFTPVASDFDFVVENIDTTFESVLLLNAYNGIVSSAGTRLTIAGLRGQPLNIGLQIDRSYDVCRLCDIHFWPYWTSNVEVWKWMVANATAIILGRVDNPMLSNIFGIFYRNGILVRNTADDSTLGPGGTTSFLQGCNVQFDSTQTALFVDSSTSAFTAQFTNLIGQGIGASDALIGSVGNNSGVVLAGAAAVVDINNLQLTQHKANSIQVTGINNVLRIANANFTNWNASSSGFPAVDVSVGAGSTAEFLNKPKIYNGTYGGEMFDASGRVHSPLARGRFDGSTDSSGNIVVPHTGQATPVEVFLQMIVCPLGTVVRVDTFTDMAFTAHLSNGSGAALASTAVAFAWEAKC